MELSNFIISVLVLNLFAYVTIRMRPYIFKVDLFKPMIWNFKLSLLPLGILLATTITFMGLLYLASLMNLVLFVYLSYCAIALGLVVWILMLPNSGYLITELNLTHRRDDAHEVPIWYDIVSIMSFAMSGIANTLLNIVLLQYVFLVGVDSANLSRGDMQSFIVSAILINTLVAIGVYLGRQIRFNSWDVMHPRSFLKKLRAHFVSKRVFGESVLFVVMHVMFFMILYFLFGIPSLF